MKILKISGIIIGTIVFGLYAAFLFVLPNAINIEKYKPEIQKLVEENCKLKLDYGSMKLYTHPMIKAGIKIDAPQITFEDGSKLFQAKDLDVRVDIFPLLFKDIKISKLSLNSPEITIDIDNNKYKFEEILYSEEKENKEETLTENKEEAIAENNEETTAEDNTETKKEESIETKTNNSAEETKDFDFTILFSNAIINNYSVSVNDLKTNDVLKLSGDYIKITDFNSAKRVIAEIIGNAKLNNNEDIKYNLAINYQIPKSTNQTPDNNDESTEQTQLINIVDIFKTYEPKTEINSDLKITGEGEKTQIKGNLYVDNFSIKLAEKRLPDSFIKLDFDKQNVKIDSDIFIEKEEKLSANGNVSYGKNTNIDLACKTEKINLKSILSLAKDIMDSMLVENDLDQFNVDGYITSDFNIKTNLKELTSNGNLKLVNGNISHNNSELKITNLKSTINLDNNTINIEDTSANVNDTKVNVTGAK